MKNSILKFTISIFFLLPLFAYAQIGVGIINGLGYDPNTGEPNMMCFNPSQSSGWMQFDTPLAPGDVNIIGIGAKAAYNMQYNGNNPCTDPVGNQYLGAGVTDGGDIFTWTSPQLNVVWQQVPIANCTNIPNQISACYQAVWESGANKHNKLQQKN